MANIGQPPALPTDIRFHCAKKWDCCQREQAKHKVMAMQRELPMAKPIRSSTEMKAVSKMKISACGIARRKLKKLTPDKLADEAAKRGSAPCLVEQIRKGEVKLSDLDVDHPLDVKIGGLTKPKLTPLNRTVNQTFGFVGKECGNRIGPGNKVTGISLSCPPSSPGCPSEDHSVAKPSPPPVKPPGV